MAEVQDDIAFEIDEAFEETLEDVGNEIQELKGILNEALGDVPFKVAVGFIIAFNFLYTSYAAFFGTTLGDASLIDDECYCSSVDRVFYRTITFGFSFVWVVFLIGYAVRHMTCNYSHCHCYNSTKDNDEIQYLVQLYAKEMADIKELRSVLQLQLEQLVNGSYLDIDYYDERKEKVKEWYDKVKSKISSQNVEEEPEENSEQICLLQAQENEQQDHVTSINIERAYDRKSIKWYIFMICKYSLILLRFIFRLLIVPLLQLQWLNDYAWNCIMDGFLRNYCGSIANAYFAGLDHSLVLYSVYVFILIALLFSVMIAWLPRGTPQISIHYDPEVKRGIIPRSIHMNRKGKYFRNTSNA